MAASLTVAVPTPLQSAKCSQFAVQNALNSQYKMLSIRRTASQMLPIREKDCSRLFASHWFCSWFCIGAGVAALTIHPKSRHTSTVAGNWFLNRLADVSNDSSGAWFRFASDFCGHTRQTKADIQQLRIRLQRRIQVQVDRKHLELQDDFGEQNNSSNNINRKTAGFIARNYTARRWPMLHG